MRGGIGRWRWRLSRRWPWLSVWKLPLMERVHWWMPDRIKTKRKR